MSNEDAAIAVKWCRLITRLQTHSKIIDKQEASRLLCRSLTSDELKTGFGKCLPTIVYHSLEAATAYCLEILYESEMIESLSLESFKSNYFENDVVLTVSDCTGLAV